jgi:hypothetical protein
MQKLEKRGNPDGVFILECNLWAFCSKKDQIGNFREKNIPPNSLANPNLEPNVPYFFGGYEEQNFRLLLKKLLRNNHGNRIYVNTDGRFEVALPYDSIKIFNRVKNKVKLYERMAAEYVPDSLRMHSFIMTIEYLKQFGSVYLVRMPVAEEILALESAFYPGFNNEMSRVSANLGVPYLDFTFLSDKHITIDGNHIHNDYIGYFNKLLAERILTIRNKN